RPLPHQGGGEQPEAAPRTLAPRPPPRPLWERGVGGEGARPMMETEPVRGYTTAAANALQDLLQRRLVVLDGAMATMIQSHRLDEEAFRGGLFGEHPSPLQGNNDLLCLTQPALIEEIHRQYLAAGADVIQTNSFNANRVSQADYGLQERVRELNLAAAAVARRAAERFRAEHPERPAFVVCSIGPANRSASISPDVSNPAYRAITFDQLAAAYR